jgi:glycolate oxidase FAD binding subunit
MTDLSADLSTEFQQQISDAVAREVPINLVGGNTKQFYGREPRGEILHVAGNRGVVDYEPTELVITVRNGTTLPQLEAILAEQGQMLGFEPPYFGQKATIGGAIACGLSGPRRPFSGAVRDHILGCKIINGYADSLSFGGEVMKNVAGYDLSRLMAGSMGTLGLIVEVSLKVVPKPEVELTWWQEIKDNEVTERMSQILQKPFPISALHYDGKRLFYRLCGMSEAINQSTETLGGEPLKEHKSLWLGLKEQTCAFFMGEMPLWRISVAPAADPLPLAGRSIMDWGGALRWLKSDESAQHVFQTVAEAGGHATLFRGGDRSGIVFQPLPPDLMQIQQRLKHAFDPKGLFNQGRMYPEF